MPRRSKADLDLDGIGVNGDPPRLKPPPSLNSDEAKVFTHLVASNSPRHFTPSDEPLLCRLSEAIALAEIAAGKLTADGAVIDGKPSAWIVVQEKCVRAIVALTMRLRLCPQSRFDQKAAARAADSAPRFRAPWK